MTTTVENDADQFRCSCGHSNRFQVLHHAWRTGRPCTPVPEFDEASTGDPDEIPPLDELVAMLGHAAEDLDLIVEHLTVHRQGLDDAARMVLRGVESETGQAWAWATRARAALREHVATAGG